MDRNNVIGFILLALLFTVWMQHNNNQQRKNIEAKAVEDSLSQVSIQQLKQDSIQALELIKIKDTDTVVDTSKSAQQVIIENDEEVTATIENELLRLVITNKGARIKEVALKNYKTSREDSEGKEIRDSLKLQQSERNGMEYLIPLANGTILNTGLLPSAVTREGDDIVLKTQLPQAAVLEQKYSLDKTSYVINFSTKIIGNPGIAPGKNISIKWTNQLDKLEKNDNYERTYSTLYFKSPGERSDYCSYTKDDVENVDNKAKLQWLSSVNQFFNSTWMPEIAFESAELSVKQGGEEDNYLKTTIATVELPAAFTSGNPFNIKMYTGPNEFNLLRAFDNDLEDVIQFGSSILGSINRWVVRPIFVFLGTLVNNQGIVILLLTLLVKLVLWPLTYKMIYSQSKMGALKPQMDKLREKHGADQQKIQMETMALYREFGVNPLGGCLPMLLQMPIWFALYRFFPAAIEFRQAEFLWATDLSSYDVFIRFPVSIPLLGHHLSLFTVLWTVTTLLYTWYNFKKIDITSTAANPALKYMQYIMPVAFMFFFNSFASGLTCYLVFSNLINIVQTLVTKNYLINNDKIQRELDNYKKKPKKKGGFQERLNEMMKEQQRQAELKNKKLK